MKKTTANPEDLIKSLPDGVRQDMQALDKMIRKVLPKDKVTVWGGTFWGGSTQTIIGYGDLTMHRSTGEPVEWFKIGLAMQKNYISIYLNTTEDGDYVVRKYGKELGPKVKTGASNISFKKLEDVNLPKLQQMLDTAKQL